MQTNLNIRNTIDCNHITVLTKQQNFELYKKLKLMFHLFGNEENYCIHLKLNCK